MIFLATCVVFLPALKNGFVWDDEANFLNNPAYRGIGWPQLKWMLTTFHMGHYQPLSWLTLGLDYSLWGMNPSGYHLTNIVLHSANALLMYWLALRLFRLAAAPELPGPTLSQHIGAAAASLLFALHPLRVESVAWVTERRDVLSGFFFLLTILSYLRANEPGSDRRSWYSLSLVSFACSLLSKAAGVPLPLVLIILDVYPLRRLSGPIREWFSAANRGIWIEKMPFVLMVLVVAALAPFAQHAAGALMAIETRGLSERFAQAVFGTGFYLWKMAVPFALSPFYAFPAKAGILFRNALVSGIALIALSAFVLRRRHEQPAMLAAWLAYLVMLPPVLGILQAGAQLAADRYTYLPGMSLAILAGSAVAHAYSRLTGSVKTVLVGGATLVVLMLGILSHGQTKIWRDTASLWTQTLKVDPDSYLAHANLGIVLAEQGRHEEAAAHYSRAIESNPEYAKAYGNLGNLLAERGQTGQAIRLYDRALQLEPNNAKTHYNLANALYKNRDVDAALRHYRKSIDLDPLYAEAHLNLASALHDRRLIQEAIEHAEEAIRIKSGFPAAYLLLGIILASDGRYAEAIDRYRQALEIKPDFAEARNSWGNALAKQGKFTEAVRQYELALEAKPDYALARMNLSRALRDSRRPTRP